MRPTTNTIYAAAALRVIITVFVIIDPSSPTSKSTSNLYVSPAASKPYTVFVSPRKFSLKTPKKKEKMPDHEQDTYLSRSTEPLPASNLRCCLPCIRTSLRRSCTLPLCTNFRFRVPRSGNCSDCSFESPCPTGWSAWDRLRPHSAASPDTPRSPPSDSAVGW